MSPLGLSVDKNADSVIREFMWGSPGTMIAALWMYEVTGATIWAERFVRDADLLWKQMIDCPEAECRVWKQALQGHTANHIGSVHGFAGNAFAILRGWKLLTEERQELWSSCLTETFLHTAIAEEGLANWPQSVGKHRPGRTDLLVQHCHGVLSAVAPLNRSERIRGVDGLSRFHNAECDDATLKKTLPARAGWNVLVTA